MTRGLILSCALVGALALSACADMSDTQRRTGTGAAIGGIAAGAITGEWGWAAAGAAAGVASGPAFPLRFRARVPGPKSGALGFDAQQTLLVAPPLLISFRGPLIVLFLALGEPDGELDAPVLVMQVGHERIPAAGAIR